MSLQGPAPPVTIIESSNTQQVCIQHWPVLEICVGLRAAVGIVEIFSPHHCTSTECLRCMLQIPAYASVDILQDDVWCIAFSAGMMWLTRCLCVCRKRQERAVLKGVLWDQKMGVAQRGRVIGGEVLLEMWTRKEGAACRAWQHQLLGIR